jgi:hypothetical protein
MAGPRTDSAGNLQLSSFSELSSEELRSWIRERLHGWDLSLKSTRDDDQMPHVLIALAYPQLDASIRRDIQAIAIEFLRDLARKPGSDWLGSAGGELLMLADPVLVDASNRAEIIDDLRHVVESWRAIGAGQVDLRFRALQALVTLRHRASKKFWLKQYQSGGDAYLPVILEGLALIDVTAPFPCLAEVVWNDVVEQSVIGFLPNVLEEYGTAKVVRALDEAMPSLSKRAQNAILQFCEEEQLTLETFDVASDRQASGSESAIELKPLQELGFSDELDGYMIVKGDKHVLRVHLYSAYFTLVWRCEPGFEPKPVGLKRHMRNCILEIAAAVGVPTETPILANDGFARINSGVAHYVSEMETKSMPFVVTPLHPSQKEDHDRNLEYLRINAQRIAFLRFDVAFECPIILWARRLNTELAEIGFSSRVFPTSVLTILQEGRPEVFPNDVPVIRRLLAQKLHPYRNQ